MTGFYTPINYSSYNDLSLQVGYSGVLSNTTVNEPQKYVSPDITDIEILNYRFSQKRWDIVDPSSIAVFLERNSGLFTEVNNALTVIPQYIKEAFRFKLELESDPEIKDFQSLYLYVVGDFTPKRAFELLETIDTKWSNSNVSDISKFNIDIEFV